MKVSALKEREEKKICDKLKEVSVERRCKELVEGAAAGRVAVHSRP